MAAGQPLGLAWAILVPVEPYNWMRRTAYELHERYGSGPFPLTIEPHVTLKQPFDVAELEPFERLFDELALDIPPLELRLRGFGFFEVGGYVYLDVEPQAPLKEIQLRILAELEPHGVAPALFENDEPVPYHFHATLAQGLDPEQLADARERYRDTPDFRFPLEELGLFRRNSEGDWTVYRRIRVTNA